MSERLESLLPAETREECRRNDPPTTAANGMRIVIIYGHPQTAVAAFRRVTELMRERAERNVALIYTVAMDASLAACLREGGAVLWYCGPDMHARAGEGHPEHADQHLVASTWLDLADRARSAVAALVEGAPT